MELASSLWQHETASAPGGVGEGGGCGMAR